MSTLTSCWLTDPPTHATIRRRRPVQGCINRNRVQMFRHWAPRVPVSGSHLSDHHSHMETIDPPRQAQWVADLRVWRGFLFRWYGGLLLCLLLGKPYYDVNAARASPFGLNLFGMDAARVEDQIQPPTGNCPTCIGVVDETLGACGAVLNCVSTFDDRPAFFIAPWEFPGRLPEAIQQMELVLAKEGGVILDKRNRYIHVSFTGEDGTTDDVEFLFSIPSSDAIVNIRAASRKLSAQDHGRNSKRLQKIRQSLMWEEVPVLRNRSRKLFFLESPWDTFGPEPPPAFDYKHGLEFVPD